MPDNNVVPPPDFWSTLQHWGTGIGMFAASLWGGAKLVQAKSAKKSGAPVAWEEALEELRREMAQGMAHTAKISNEAKEEAVLAREEARKLREKELTLMARRMERFETQAEGDRQETASILDRLVHDMTLLKQKLLPGLSKPPERLPE